MRPTDGDEGAADGEERGEVDGESFRQGMRRLCGGVTIVTSRFDDRPVGLTATAVCSLSAEPPRLIACINRAGLTCRGIARSRILCVNLLSRRHESLALRFAGRTEEQQERFAEGDWTTLASGAPVLEDALAAFDCRVAMLVDTGSHAIVIADILRVRLGPCERPLIYVSARFDTPSGGLGDPADEEDGESAAPATAAPATGNHGGGGSKS